MLFLVFRISFSLEKNVVQAVFRFGFLPKRIQIQDIFNVSLAQWDRLLLRYYCWLDFIQTSSFFVYVPIINSYFIHITCVQNIYSFKLQHTYITPQRPVSSTVVSTSTLTKQWSSYGRQTWRWTRSTWGTSAGRCGPWAGIRKPTSRCTTRWTMPTAPRVPWPSSSPIYSRFNTITTELLFLRSLRLFLFDVLDLSYFGSYLFEC